MSDTLKGSFNCQVTIQKVTVKEPLMRCFSLPCTKIRGGYIWTRLIVDGKEDFDGYDLLINKGLPKIEASEGITKVKILLEVLSHHLEEDLPLEISQ